MLTIAKLLLDNERIKVISDALDFLGIETILEIEKHDDHEYLVKFVDPSGNEYRVLIDSLDERVLDEFTSRCILNKHDLRLHAILWKTFMSPMDADHGIVRPTEWNVVDGTGVITYPHTTVVTTGVWSADGTTFTFGEYVIGQSPPTVSGDPRQSPNPQPSSPSNPEPGQGSRPRPRSSPR